MSNQRQPIGIFGGTFDPVHNAHLRVALDVLEQLSLAEIRFIPSRQPPHRHEPGARPEQRRAMLARALIGQAGFRLDGRELDRTGPSYTVDTLHALRAELAATPLWLLLGRDAFRELTTWHRWQEIPQLAHLIVLQRPGYQADWPAPLAELIARQRGHKPTELAELYTRPAGGVWQQPVTQLGISASAIRALLAQGRSPRYLVPEAVFDYIREQNLYAPATSESSCS